VGADLQQWFHEMPKTITPEIVSPRKPKIMTYGKKNINEHFSSTQCLSCGVPAGQGVYYFSVRVPASLPVLQVYVTFVPSRVKKPLSTFAPGYE